MTPAWITPDLAEARCRPTRRGIEQLPVSLVQPPHLRCVQQQQCHYESLSPCKVPESSPLEHMEPVIGISNSFQRGVEFGASHCGPIISHFLATHTDFTGSALINRARRGHVSQSFLHS